MLLALVSSMKIITKKKKSKKEKRESGEEGGTNSIMHFVLYKVTEASNDPTEVNTSNRFHRLEHQMLTNF